MFTIVMASVAPEKFLSQRNIISMLISASSYIVVAVGMTFVMTGGGIDLSVGSVMGLSAAFIAVPVKHTPIDPILAVFLGLGAGTLLGLVNGLIITKLKIPDFIATLATMLAYRGFAQVWIGARILSRFPAAITYLGNARWGIVPVCVIVAVLVVVAGYFLYTRTKFGRYTIAIGGNRRAAIHAGIPVDRYSRGRHRRHRPVRWDRAGVGLPSRCAIYHYAHKWVGGPRTFLLLAAIHGGRIDSVGGCGLHRHRPQAVAWSKGWGVSRKSSSGLISGRQASRQEY